MSSLGNSGIKDVLVFGPFTLVAAERLLKKDDLSLPLGGRALDVLKALLERAGDVVTHDELMERAWPHVKVAEANLRVQIGAIRKILGDGQDGARYIANVAGRGYSFVATVHRLTPLALNGASE